MQGNHRPNWTGLGDLGLTMRETGGGPQLHLKKGTQDWGGGGGENPWSETCMTYVGEVKNYFMLTHLLCSGLG